MPSAVMDQLQTFGPTQCAALSEAQAMRYVRRFTRRHGENFSVLSPLVPHRLRQPMAAVYAFCRWADDLADQAPDRDQALELLHWWRSELTDCFAGRPRHPVFVALNPVITTYQLPRQPFDDLIDAFEQDQTVDRYESWDQLLAYCQRSANPVGRLVLALGDCLDEERAALSDATCTALQLANFWQDVRRDALERDRIYIPRGVANRHGLSLQRLKKEIDASADLNGGKAAASSALDVTTIDQYRAVLGELVAATWPYFQRGRELWPSVPAELRPMIELFTLGGERVLTKIEAMDYQTWAKRPRVGRWSKTLLLGRAVARRLYWSRLAGEPGRTRGP
jgi:squalene synthase HpnC